MFIRRILLIFLVLIFSGSIAFVLLRRPKQLSEPVPPPQAGMHEYDQLWLTCRSEAECRHTFPGLNVVSAVDGYKFVYVKEACQELDPYSRYCDEALLDPRGNVLIPSIWASVVPSLILDGRPVVVGTVLFVQNRDSTLRANGAPTQAAATDNSIVFMAFNGSNSKEYSGQTLGYWKLDVASRHLEQLRYPITEGLNRYCATLSFDRHVVADVAGDLVAPKTATSTRVEVRVFSLLDDRYVYSRTLGQFDTVDKFGGHSPQCWWAVASTSSDETFAYNVYDASKDPYPPGESLPLLRREELKL